MIEISPTASLEFAEEAKFVPPVRDRFEEAGEVPAWVDELIDLVDRSHAPVHYLDAMSNAELSLVYKLIKAREQKARLGELGKRLDLSFHAVVVLRSKRIHVVNHTAYCDSEFDRLITRTMEELTEKNDAKPDAGWSVTHIVNAWGDPLYKNATERSRLTTRFHRLAKGVKYGTSGRRPILIKAEEPGRFFPNRHYDDAGMNAQEKAEFAVRDLFVSIFQVPLNGRRLYKFSGARRQITQRTLTVDEQIEAWGGYPEVTLDEHEKYDEMTGKPRSPEELAEELRLKRSRKRGALRSQAKQAIASDPDWAYTTVNPTTNDDIKLDKKLRAEGMTDENDIEKVIKQKRRERPSSRSMEIFLKNTTMVSYVRSGHTVKTYIPEPEFMKGAPISIEAVHITSNLAWAEIRPVRDGFAKVKRGPKRRRTTVALHARREVRWRTQHFGAGLGRAIKACFDLHLARHFSDQKLDFWADRYEVLLEETPVRAAEDHTLADAVDRALTAGCHIRDDLLCNPGAWFKLKLEEAARASFETAVARQNSGRKTYGYDGDDRAWHTYATAQAKREHYDGAGDPEWFLPEDLRVYFFEETEVEPEEHIYTACLDGDERWTRFERSAFLCALEAGCYRPLAAATRWYEREIKFGDFDTEPTVCLIQDIADLVKVDWPQLSYGMVKYPNRRSLDIDVEDDVKEDLETDGEDLWFGDIDE